MLGILGILTPNHTGRVSGLDLACPETQHPVTSTGGVTGGQGTHLSPVNPREAPSPASRTALPAAPSEFSLSLGMLLGCVGWLRYLGTLHTLGTLHGPGDTALTQDTAEPWGHCTAWRHCSDRTLH